MTSVPVLPVLDFLKVFMLETNASSKDLGVVLSQEQQPLLFLVRLFQ